MKNKNIVLVSIVVFIVIQFIPYGREHKNPEVLTTPQWNSSTTKEFFYKACADCHSNETKWPWYSNIAPISWLVTRDVNEGREHFNISTLGFQKKNEAHEAYEEVEEKNMPMPIYLIAHPEARLTDSQIKEFIKGLKETFKQYKKDD